MIAIDLGGTNLRMALVNRDGEIIDRTKRETPRENTEEIVETIVSVSKSFFETYPKRICSIGLAVPATVNADKGEITKAPNLPFLDMCPITEKIGKNLNIPCVLENDANAAAIGENWLGASRNYKNSIMVTLGTGVGGGIIIDGKILRGVDGTAAEIGHICVQPLGEKCGCGSFGCVEQYSSANAVVRMTKELLPDYPESSLNEIENLTSRTIYQKADGGDELALEIFRRQGFYLGIALAGLINVLNPEVIVIGGGASDGWELFTPEMLGQIKKRAYKQPVDRVKIVRAECADDAGILGAAFLAFEIVK